MDKITEYVNLFTKAEEHFRTNYWDIADENARFRRGKHWTEDEEKTIKEANRIPYNIPVLESKLNTLISQQMQTPYDIIALPRTQDDEVAAEVKNAIFKYVRDTNDLTYLLSEWFGDAMVKKYGVLKRVIDTTEDVQGEVRIEKVIYNQFLWDTNCKKFNIARYANWVCEVMWFTRDELLSLFPDKKDLIMKLPETADNTSTYKNWYRNDRGTELIRVLKWGQRKFKKSWKTTYNDGNVDYLDEEPTIEDKYSTEEFQKFAEQGVTMPTDTLEQENEYIEYTLFTADIPEALDEYTEQTNVFRYHVNFCINDDGEISCFVDMIKDAQRFLDRLLTQIDTSIGKLIKNSYEINWDALHTDDQNKWTELSKQLVTGGAVLRRRGNEKIINAIDGNQTPPELFTMFTMIMQILDDMAGGRNYQGLQESAGESGKAILARQEQGFLMAYLFLYNLGRALKGLGEGINEDINELYGNSVERIVDITDNDLDEMVKQEFIKQGIYEQGKFRKSRGYLKINQEVGEWLGKAKTRLIIERGKYQPTERERKLDEWKMLNEWMITSGQQPYPATIMLDEFSFSPTIKEKIKQHEEKLAQQQQQMQDVAMKEKLFNANLQQQNQATNAFKALPQEQNNTVKSTVTGE